MPILEEINLKDIDYNKLTPEQKKQAEQLKNTAKRYQGKSRSELLAELDRIKQTQGGKNITPEKLQQFKRKVSPMLNSEQKKRLDEIMNRLNKSNT